MTWPSPQEFSEAIQNPKFCFDDPELKAGSPQSNAMGLPIPSSGNFATVYRMRCGAKEYAVRCFINYHPDQEKRYQKISDHLLKTQLKYMVPFEFQAKGMRVNGKFYPIVKMAWISGDRLDQYVYRHLNSPAKLLSLASEWLHMCRILRASKIGHGDLQHGNVLLANDQLKLIDYDGMFVPSLQGSKSHEVGHRNYQHPHRTGADFADFIDNFSAWVIYTSLLALSRDPQLWATTKAGDESLLFKQEDYKSPQSSAVLKALATHNDDLVREIAGFIGDLPCNGIAGVIPIDERFIAKLQKQNAGPGSSRPSWFSNNMSSMAVDGLLSCPLCQAKLVQKTAPVIGQLFLECSQAPRCIYRRDLQDEPLVTVTPSAPVPLQSLGFNPSATSAAGQTPQTAPSQSTQPVAPSATSTQVSIATTYSHPVSQPQAPVPAKGRRRKKATKNTVPVGIIVPDDSCSTCSFCGSLLHIAQITGGETFYICSDAPHCTYMYLF